LIKALNDEFEVQVSSKTEKIIEYQLGAFSKESNTEQGIIDGLETTKNRINIHNTYKTAKDLFQSAIDSRDLKQLLLIYNRKSLLDRISNIFGLKSGEYSKLIVRLLKGNRQDEIILALKEYLPNL